VKDLLWPRHGQHSPRDDGIDGSSVPRVETRPGP
jgi:hypothetical protein